jgi:hypothetical protein
MQLTLYGPVDSNSTLYVRREIDNQVLLSINRGEYLNLRGGRQTGKTTLVLNLRKQLDQAGVISAFIDLSTLGTTNIDEVGWLREFGQSLQASVRPEHIRESIPVPPINVGGFPEYIYSIVRLFGERRRFVVFVDEVTAVPEVLRHSFFSTIRSMYNQRTDVGAPVETQDVSFVFAGSFDPERFIGGNNSPFNVARDFDTSNADFTSGQVKDLASKVDIEKHAEAIYASTNGHPYLTNRLLSLTTEGATVDDAVKNILQADSNLRHIARRLREENAPSLPLAFKIRDGSTMPCTLGLSEQLDYLMVIGLVKSNQDGNALIRCQLYEQLLDMIRQTLGSGGNAAAKPSSPIDFLPSSSITDHTKALIELAPKLATESPSLAAICVGAALEAVLLIELERIPDLNPAIQKLNQEVAQKRINPNLKITKLQPSDWKLAQMIEVARFAGLITQSSSQVSHGIRDWRNLVHPAKFRVEFPKGVPPEIADASIATVMLLLHEIQQNRTP